MLALKLASALVLMACGTSRPNIEIKRISGEKLDKIRYEPPEEIENLLIKNAKDEIEVEVEKKLIPRGGRLHIKNSKHRWTHGSNSQPNHIISSVVVQKGTVTFVCDEPDIDVSEYSNPPPSKGFNWGPYTAGRTEKSVIHCSIEKKMSYPFEVRILGYTGDTTSVYQVDFNSEKGSN